MSDITSTLIGVALQYNALWDAGKIDEANAIVESNPDLINTIMNADKWNKLRDAIIAIERFFLEDVETFINRVAQITIGINDEVADEDKATNTYSAQKIDGLISNLQNQQDNSQRIVLVTFLADDWAGESAPYTQTVTASEISSSDEPALFKYKDADLSYDENKAYNKAFGFISDGIGDCGDGSVTWACYKKPAIDITIALKGV